MNENEGAGRRKNVSAVQLTKVGGVLNAGEEPAPGAAIEKAGEVKGPKTP